MSIRETLERTTENIGAQMREGADHLLEKIGSESRQIGERVGDSIVARVGDLSDSALARLNLVTERRARQRAIAGVATGIFIGFLIARFFGGEAGAKRREAMRNRFASDNGDYSPRGEDSRSAEESEGSEDLGGSGRRTQH